MLGAEIRRRGDAESARASSSSSREGPQDPLGALRAGRGEAPERGPADQDRVGAEGERDRHVDPAADAAVDQHGGPPGDRLDRSPAAPRRWRRARSSWRPPWLETTTPAAPCSTASAASSAVRRPLTSSGTPASAAIPPRSSQVSAGSSASKVSRDRRPAARAAERGGDAGELELGGDREAGAEVALAVAAGRRVDGEDDRLEARLDRLRPSAPG